MKIIKYSLNIFILLTLLSCSEENEKKISNKATINLISKNNSTLEIINGDSLAKLKKIIKSKNTKNSCHSNLLKIYFSELNINFDQNDFKLEILEDANQNTKFSSIKYENGNCEILLPLN